MESFGGGLKGSRRSRWLISSVATTPPLWGQAFLSYNEPFLRYRGRHVTRSDRRNKAPAEDFKTVDRFWDGRTDGWVEEEKVCQIASLLLSQNLDQRSSWIYRDVYTGLRVKLSLNREIPRSFSMWCNVVLNPRVWFVLYLVRSIRSECGNISKLFINI